MGVCVSPRARMSLSMCARVSLHVCVSLCASVFISLRAHVCVRVRACVYVHRTPPNSKLSLGSCNCVDSGGGGVGGIPLALNVAVLAVLVVVVFHNASSLFIHSLTLILFVYYL